jgi:hypothetical protein
MDDVLLAIDLDHRPVGVHGDDPAAGEAPQQTGALQVIKRAYWMTSEQGGSVPAQVGGPVGPKLAQIEKSCAVIEEKLPSVSGDA